MSDQTPGAADHLPPWTQGDATDTRGQIFKGIKLDQGVQPVAGLPLIFKNPGYVFGQINNNSIADNSINGAKLITGTTDPTKLIPGAVADILFSSAIPVATWGKLTNIMVAVGAAIDLAKIDSAGASLAAAMVLGTPLGNANQQDMATIATANTTYAGGAFGADMATDARTLQVRLLSAFRVSAWGASIAVSGNVTFSRISSAGSSTVTVVITNAQNMTSAGNPAPFAQIVDSGWVNMGSEAIQAWNINSTFAFTTARPTGTIYMQAYIRGV